MLLHLILDKNLCVLVKIKFMCQLDGSIESSNIILGVFVRVYLDEIN